MDQITYLKHQISCLTNRIQQDQMALQHCYWQIRMLQDEQLFRMRQIAQPPPPTFIQQSEVQQQQQQIEWTTANEVTESDLRLPSVANPTISPRLEVPSQQKKKKEFPHGSILLESSEAILKIAKTAEVTAYAAGLKKLPEKTDEPTFIRYPIYLNNVKTDESMESKLDQEREGMAKEVWDGILQILQENHPESQVRVEEMFKRNNSNYKYKTLTLRVYVELNDHDRVRIKKKIYQLRNQNGVKIIKKKEK